MYVTLGAYLDELKGKEGQKPVEKRQPVPTIAELADVAGVHYVTLNNISNDRVDRLNLNTTQKVLDELWRRGFHPQVSDIIKYDPPEG